MRLNEVYRWRYLADCIDLLKLTPLRAGEPVKSGSDFILTTRTGHSKSLQGTEALIEELGKEHLDRVRNNRNGAVKDRYCDKSQGFWNKLRKKEKRKLLTNEPKKGTDLWPSPPACSPSRKWRQESWRFSSDERRTAPFCLLVHTLGR
jgi:hypothetical protein